MKKYFPIVVSKKGELLALQHLTQDVKDEICPIIEVLQGSIEKKTKEHEVQKIVYKEDFENFLKTHWKFFDNQIIFDFSLFPNVEEKIGDVKKIIINLLKAGVNVIPAIDENSNHIYLKTVKELVTEYRLTVCIKYFEYKSDIDTFSKTIHSILSNTGLETSRAILLIDAGQVQSNTFSSKANLIKQALRSLSTKIEDWFTVVIAAGSFPEDLSDFKEINNPNRITRHEWEFWNRFKTDESFSGLQYGDFGIRNPIYDPVGYAGTISIRYTTEKDFLIFKGKKTDKHLAGHGQYTIHAFQLTQNGDYYGRGFSWGDLRINEIAQQDYMDEDKRKPGSSTTWIEISQNHHFTLMHSLL